MENKSESGRKDESVDGHVKEKLLNEKIEWSVKLNIEKNK